MPHKTPREKSQKGCETPEPAFQPSPLLEQRAIHQPTDWDNVLGDQYREGKMHTHPITARNH